MSSENTVQRKKDLIVFFGLIIVVIAMVVIILVAGTSNEKPQTSKAAKSSKDSVSKDNTVLSNESAEKTDNTLDAENQNTKIEQVSTPTKALPKLIDLGSTRCKPCIAMEPVLEALKKEYSDYFDVEFINVNEEYEKAQKYNINLIPTQIFFDADGKELFRHVGFYSKEEIIMKWSELGIKLTK